MIYDKMPIPEYRYYLASVRHVKMTTAQLFKTVRRRLRAWWSTIHSSFIHFFIQIPVVVSPPRTSRKLKMGQKKKVKKVADVGTTCADMCRRTRSRKGSYPVLVFSLEQLTSTCELLPWELCIQQWSRRTVCCFSCRPCWCGRCHRSRQHRHFNH
jgi:hypothetical protein